jgi:hypothetical protein
MDECRHDNDNDGGLDSRRKVLALRKGTRGVLASTQLTREAGADDEKAHAMTGRCVPFWLREPCTAAVRTPRRGV